ncbi:MAG: YicC family protein [Acidobacteria bacterium]|nr:YicC family protein [Acidobacteriota bacterium]
MIRSMTGYGRGRAAEGEMAVAVEVRSVNARGREIRIRLPQELISLEGELREQVQREVARGRVDVFVTLEGVSPDAARYSFNPAGAAAMYAAWRRLQEVFSLPDAPTAAALLGLPGVIEALPGPGVDAGRVQPLLAAALAHALDEHRTSREREGRQLAMDLWGRVAAIGRLAEDVRGRAAAAPARMAAQLRERVRALMAEVPVDEQRVALEIALAAQRADVTEELVRLDAHIKRLAALFEPGASEVGRTLEFLVQEVRREVSTLGAKIGEPEIDASTLAIKGELERLREQAANLE